jgi:CubicO group peptidase (beta-lactamase class C family)
MMMTRRSKIVALVGSLSAGLFTGACAGEVLGSAGLAGRWGGALGSGPGVLRLVLEIAPDQPIVLVSVDQGNGRIPATGGTCGGRNLDLQFGAVRGRLKLALNAQGALEGTWNQGREQTITFTKLAAGQNPVAAAPAPFGELQAEVDAARLKSNAPALGAAFVGVKSGAVLTQEAVSGLVVAGQPTAVTDGLKWHMGSITKSMTATLVARLVERGLLSWDMKLKDAFGDLAPAMQASYRDKTLAQLMTGQSGMPTNIGTADFIGHAANDKTPTERRKLWVQQALAMRPESGFVYPNNGYVLAGALCEKVTGKAYETLMMEEVFTPLGITTAGFGAPPVGNPQGHRKAILGGRMLAVGIGDGADNPQAMAPAGRAHMTLPDLAKFGLAHSEGHQGLRNDYLSQETWRFLHTPPVRTPSGNDYAYGWIARPDGTLWHNGSNTYWLAELAFDPAKSIAACACANYASAEAAVGRVLAAGMAKAAAA